MKHEIEIPDLPDGWEAVAYRYAYGNEYVLSDGDIEQIRQSIEKTSTKRLIVRKKQPRRIVLEESGEIRKPKAGEYIQNNGNYCLCRKPDRWGNEHEIWKIVEDNK